MDSKTIEKMNEVKEILNEKKDILEQTKEEEIIIQEKITENKNQEANENKIEIDEEKIENQQNKKKMPIWKKIIITVLILGMIGLSTLLILFYGPNPTFRDWWITTAMTTMSHKYLAEWFFDEETINEVLAKNRIEETDETTDTSLIVITPKDEKEEIHYKNEYEKQILAKNLDKEKYNIYAEGENYRIIEIEGTGYKGYLAAIYDPSKIKVATSKYIGSAGQYLTDISKQNNAVIAINGGGFLDENSQGNGSTPLGIVMAEGKLVANNGNTVGGGLIGFDKDNKLVIGKMSVSAAKTLGIRDAVTFAPFLIVNGESAKIKGNGGWGTAPRSAIGQRKDGIVLFLVLDGRRLTMPGASIKDLIEIMENYGAYNAANLDGGTSSVMVVNKKDEQDKEKWEIINDPVDSTGAHKTRFISTGFILTKE